MRSVQVHDEPVERAEAGQRVALALPGIERTALRRGDALVEPGSYPRQLPASTSSSRSSSRSATTPGSTSITARPRSRPGSSGSATGSRSFASREPVVAARGDRVVLRNATTLGGGRVLDPAPPRELGLGAARAAGDGRSRLDRAGARARARAPVGARTARACSRPTQLDEGLAAVEHAGDWYFSEEWLEQTRREARTRLTLRAEAAPLDPGLADRRSARGRAVGRSDPPAPRARASRGQGLPARRGCGPRRARSRGGGARGQARGSRLRLRSRSRTPSSRASSRSEGRLVRVGDGLAIGVGGLRGGQASPDRGVRASRQDHARPLPRPARHLAPAGPAPAGALRRRRDHAPRRRRARPEARSYDRPVGSGMGPVAQPVFKTGAVV